MDHRYHPACRFCDKAVGARLRVMLANIKMREYNIWDKTPTCILILTKFEQKTNDIGLKLQSGDYNLLDRYFTC